MSEPLHQVGGGAIPPHEAGLYAWLIIGALFTLVLASNGTLWAWIDDEVASKKTNEIQSFDQEREYLIIMRSFQRLIPSSGLNLRSGFVLLQAQKIGDLVYFQVG